MSDKEKDGSQEGRDALNEVSFRYGDANIAAYFQGKSAAEIEQEIQQLQTDAQQAVQNNQPPEQLSTGHPARDQLARDLYDRELARRGKSPKEAEAEREKEKEEAMQAISGMVFGLAGLGAAAGAGRNQAGAGDLFAMTNDARNMSRGGDSVDDVQIAPGGRQRDIDGPSR